jgi:CheY-like chemotaxis protein
MPILNGREVIAMIKEQQDLEEIPLVVFSTSSYPGDVTYCSAHGVELITKPFGMKLLIEIAERLVTRYS